MVLTILILWVALPFYWGSLWKEEQGTSNLKAWVINLADPDSAVFSALSNAVQQSVSGPPPYLGWEIVGSDYFTGDKFGGNKLAEIEHRVVEEQAWLAVVVNRNADQNLLQARQNGDASYQPSNAVTIYVETARNDEAFSLVISSQITKVIGGGAFLGSRISHGVLLTDFLAFPCILALTTASAQSAAQYLNGQAGNVTAMNLLANAPSTISGGYAYTQTDLRPYTKPGQWKLF